MAAVIDLTGLDRLTARLRMIVDPDATPLMRTWMRIIADDNRRGVLAGIDKDGAPMKPVTYRPVGAPTKLTAAQKNNARRRGKYLGFGDHPAGVNNNLASSEYRRLGGPPLAPRGAFSRVITNLLTAFGRVGSSWGAIGYWNEVVNRDGQQFLEYHFNGAPLKHGRLPKRDLRGIRPEGRQKAAQAARAWMIDQIRSNS
jgi:hypothetical protein